MKNAHYITVRVFIKPEEDEEKIKQTIQDIIGVDEKHFEKERVEVKKETVLGFQDRKIQKVMVTLHKNNKINDFLQRLNNNLNDEDLLALRKQDNRIDDDMNFYLRLRKKELLNGTYVLTDKGNCYHVKINLATYPKKKIKAKEIIRRVIKEV